AAGIQNIELIEANAEEIDFSEESFNAIFCTYAIVLFTDIPKILKNWHRFLKKGGIVTFSCHSETSYFTPVITQACAKFGVSLPNIHEPLGTPERCFNLMREVGFQEIKIKTNQFGQYMSLTEAQNFWQGCWLHPLNPLRKLSNEQIGRITAEYSKEIEIVATDQGVWHENTTFFVTGRK
ncbi:MAG: class I SAM-dependent methyltransferase, partial [Microcystaceae cyanobacterium]